MSYLGTVLLVAGKDLKTEIRSREQIASLIAWENSRDVRERAMREGMGAFMMSFSGTLTDSDVAQAATVKTPLFGDSTTIGGLARMCGKRKYCQNSPNSSLTLPSQMDRSHCLSQTSPCIGSPFFRRSTIGWNR